MKKNQGALFLVITSFFFIFSCSKPLQPQYLGFENLQINKNMGNESIVSASVKFYNPNNFPLQLKQADINLMLNDKQVAHDLLDSTINIPKLDSFYVPVSFSLSLNSILNNALQFLLSRKTKVNADGFIKLKKSGISFTVPIHYESYQSLDSLLQSVR